MKSLHLRVLLAVSMSILSCGLLLAAAWPVSHVQTVVALPDLILPGSDGKAGAGLLEQRQIVIEEPEIMRVDDVDWLRLSLTLDKDARKQAAGSQPDDLYNTHNIVAVARLEMPGLGAWSKDLREPLRPGRAVNFRWALRASQAGKARGVLWISLELVPKEGGEVQKIIVLSRPVALQSISIVGLPAWVGRWAGGIGLSASAGVLLISGWIARTRAVNV